jgi:hypothetical protein
MPEKNPSAVTRQETNPVIAANKTTSIVKSQIPPLASKPSTKIAKSQMPQCTVPNHFDDKLTLFQRRSMEWSEEFNKLMSDLAAAKKVTYPL